MTIKSWLKTQKGRIWSVVTMFFLTILYSTIAAIFMLLSILLVNKSFDSFQYKVSMWLIWFLIVAACSSGCLMSLQYIYIFYQAEYKNTKMTTLFLVLISLTELFVLLFSVCLIYFIFNVNTVMMYMIDQIDIDMILNHQTNEFVSHIKTIMELKYEFNLIFRNSLMKLPDMTYFLKPDVVLIFPVLFIAFKFLSIVFTVALNFLCFVSFLLIYFQLTINAETFLH